MAKTKIEWATHTWNPITGITLRPDRLDEPLRWQKPRNVFVVSMGDLFHDDVDEKYIAKVLGIIGLAPKHTFMILTKRPDRMKELFDDEDFVFHIGWFQSQAVREFDLRITLDELKPWPFKNLWLGVTAENQQRADERIPILLQIPAVVRFISVESMLGPVDLSVYLGPEINKAMLNPEARCGHHGNLLKGKPCIYCFPDRLDWVICGGESGPGARPMHPDWARSLRDQCQTAGVPFLFKQWGEFAPAHLLEPHIKIDFNDGALHCMKKVGKKRAGQLLDGQVWDQFPEKGVII